MNLNDAKCLEYSISLFEEYLTKKFPNAKLPKYDIVWRMNDRLMLGKLLFRSSQYNTPAIKKLTSNFQIKEDLLSFVSQNKAQFPDNVRVAWAKKYADSFNNPLDLYKNSAVLLRESIDFVKNLQNKQIQNIQPIMFNVNYLENEVHLDFLLLNQDVDLQPVSLISISEN